MNERFLITTADERSWKYDRPVLFLGEWCRRYDREFLWSSLDAEIARPVVFAGEAHWRMLDEVAAMALELLTELATALDEFHGRRHPLRFWQILLSHWIHRFTSVIFHRWHAVIQARADFTIVGTIALDSPGFGLAVPDTGAFIAACGDPLWNNVLIATIYEHLSGTVAEKLPVDAREAPSPSTRSATRGGLQGFAHGVAAALQRESDALIIHSYLPRRIATLLNLRLGQLPRRRVSPQIHAIPANGAQRTRLRVGPAGETGLKGFARSILPRLLPSCFLEGFESLKREAAALDWPTRPRFIFTSNSFDSDEVFKFWTAQKTTEGIPYIIGQHGNNYGSARRCPYESEASCVATSDAFVTWGWREADPKYLPAFIFKTAGMHRGVWNPRGGLLLIELSLPHLVQPWDPYPQFAEYQEEQFRFVGALPARVRTATLVRLHREHTGLPWCESQRWQLQNPTLSIDLGATPIGERVAQSRLVVHSYDSTGILETLALDVPTLAFWSGGLEHVRDAARPYYRALIDAGIVHESAQAAAAKAAEVWDDVGSWWASEPIQSARRLFCSHYARESPAPVRELAALLKSVKGFERAGK